MRAGERQRGSNKGLVAMEEMVVGEIEGFDKPSNRKSILSDKPEYDGPSKFSKDDDEENDGVEALGVPEYNSDDSSDDEDKADINNTNPGKGLYPRQLPISLPKPIHSSDSILPMYACQLNKSGDDNQQSLSSSNIDPPYYAPFLPSSTSRDEKFKESKFWMLFKFPTRIPPLDTDSSLQGRKMKSNVNAEEEVENGTPDTALFAGSDERAPSTQYDDAMKDIAPGRYGKIVIYKSGKAVLVIGENEGSQVKMIVNEGIQCGFYQQAVSINASNAEYVPVGEVTKSFVVTPDIDEDLM